MKIPEGLKDRPNSNKVCKLKKSLYSLKQSLRAWFERFAKAIKKFRYTRFQSDHSICQTFSWWKDIYHYCICKWYHSDQKSWKRDWRTQEVSSSWIRGQIPRKPEILSQNGIRKVQDKNCGVTTQVCSWLTQGTKDAWLQTYRYSNGSHHQRQKEKKTTFLLTKEDTKDWLVNSFTSHIQDQILVFLLV